jgi:hypothetical protein
VSRNGFGSTPVVEASVRRDCLGNQASGEIPHVRTHEVIRNGAAARWYDKKERDPGSDRGAPDTSKSAPPERVRPPLSAPRPDRAHTLAGALRRRSRGIPSLRSPEAPR